MLADLTTISWATQIAPSHLDTVIKEENLSANHGLGVLWTEA